MHLEQAPSIYKLTAFPSVPVLCLVVLWLAVLFWHADNDLPGLVQGVCHRDLKLENTLLDGRPAPRLKICDFGYSKVTVRPSSVGKLTHAPC